MYSNCTEDEFICVSDMSYSEMTFLFFFTVFITLISASCPTDEDMRQRRQSYTLIRRRPSPVAPPLHHSEQTYGWDEEQENYDDSNEESDDDEEDEDDDSYEDSEGENIS